MTRNLVFIDRRVADYPSLIAGLGADTEWGVLPAKLQNALDKAAGSLPRSNICTFSVTGNSAAFPGPAYGACRCNGERSGLAAKSCFQQRGVSS
jgi:hypothetical protein